MSIGITEKEIAIIFQNVIINTVNTFKEFSESLELVDKWANIIIKPHEIKEENEPKSV